MIIATTCFGQVGPKHVAAIIIFILYYMQHYIILFILYYKYILYYIQLQLYYHIYFILHIALCYIIYFILYVHFILHFAAIILSYLFYITFQLMKCARYKSPYSINITYSTVMTHRIVGNSVPLALLYTRCTVNKIYSSFLYVSALMRRAVHFIQTSVSRRDGCEHLSLAVKLIRT